jgi:signal transduction histidine kinase
MSLISRNSPLGAPTRASGDAGALSGGAAEAVRRRMVRDAVAVLLAGGLVALLASAIELVIGPSELAERLGGAGARLVDPIAAGLGTMVAGVLWFAIRRMREAQSAAAEAAGLRQELVHVATREQHRIARNLHDGVGQTLAGLSLVSGAMAQRLTKDDHTSAADADRLHEGLTDAIDGLRHTSRILYPAPLARGGLGPALRELAESTRATFGVECRAHAGDAEGVSFDETISIQAYYIAQEAVRNAVRHGNVGRIDVTLACEHTGARSRRWTLTIDDDGAGFAWSEVREGLGLRIMRARAEQIGGRFDIAPRPGSGPSSGTCVRCTWVEKTAGTAPAWSAGGDSAADAAETPWRDGGLHSEHSARDAGTEREVSTHGGR